GDDAGGRPRRRQLPPPGADQHAPLVRALDRAVPLLLALAGVALLERRRDALVRELGGGAGADPLVGVARRVRSALRAPPPLRLARARSPGLGLLRDEDDVSVVVGVLHFAAAVALFLYGLNAYFLLAIHWWNRRRIREAVTPEPPPEWPSVTVQLPLYNERYVARRLLEAVGALDYPSDRLAIQVLDDSTAATAMTMAQAVGIDGHFAVEQSARFWGNLLLNFNGTAGVWRKAAIEDAGGWAHDTLTEDLDLSYRAQLRGWRIVYRPDLVCPAELPVL